MKIFEILGNNLNNKPGTMNTIINTTNGTTGNTNADNNSTNGSNQNFNMQMVPPEVKQKLTPGSTITAPVGPNKVPTQLKITSVGTDQNKNVTLTDPKNPNNPGQVYKYADLAKMYTPQNNSGNTQPSNANI